MNNKPKNGSLPINLPKLVKGGDPITAKWANEIRSAVQGLRDRQPSTDNGKKILSPKIFQPIVRNSENSETLFEVHVWEGLVIERIVSKLSDGLQIKMHEVKNSFDEELGELVWLGINPDQAAYVKFETDLYGKITSEPEIVVDTKDVSQLHYYPLVGDYAGQNGLCYYKICELEVTDKNEAKLIYFHMGDHITHYAERVTMRNLSDESSGEVYNVLKTYIPEEDTVDFRSLKQLDGDGVPIISDDGENSIPFRRIKGLGSPDGQVQVTEDGGAILVRGNGIDGTLTWLDCDDAPTLLLEWKDGLIITAGAQEFKAGCAPTATPTGTP